MSLRFCLGCGKLTVGSRCVDCSRPANAPWSRRRDRAAQSRFRTAVLKKAGRRCEFIELVPIRDGIEAQRCHEVDRLEAHHREPGNDDPMTGQALCQKHHAAVDPKARMTSRTTRKKNP